MRASQEVRKWEGGGGGGRVELFCFGLTTIGMCGTRLCPLDTLQILDTLCQDKMPIAHLQSRLLLNSCWRRRFSSVPFLFLAQANLCCYFTTN